MVFFGGLIVYTFLISIIFAANKYNFFYCLTLLIFRVMDYKLNIVSISPTWHCSRHKFIVSINKDALGYCCEDHYKYVVSKLIEIFGSCEYFWDGSFLCGLK